MYLALAGMIVSIFYFFLPPLLNDTSNFLASAPKYLDSVSIWDPLQEDSLSKSKMAVQNFSTDLTQSRQVVSGFTSGSSLPQVVENIRTAISSVSQGFIESISFIFGGILSSILIIVKPLTMAAGLDAGVVSETDTYTDEGFLKIDDYTIYNFDKKGRGVVNMQAVLDNSLNTGVVYVARKLGQDAFKDYFTKFGLAEKTLVDLPDEGSGSIANLDSKRDINFATASFGQGIAVTPINMTRALASLANGGYLIRPHVVSEINYKGFPTKKINTEESGKVLSEDTSRRITAMLVHVVDKALLKGTVALPHYSIAAKTGTAQISNPNGGYYTDRYLHSFFGYFPAYDPKFLVFLYAVHPQNAEYASQTLTMPFMDITQFLLNYYQIPPDR
jgi:cell division protein FtsI (penicillin-binding protein 3)/stage V sporulation protein D (sporulation-specific penicillin-binding protein)